MTAPAIPAHANLREVGRYPTRDGFTIASGRLYRGAELCALDSDITRHLVDVLGIERVIDLRMDDEVEVGGPASLPGSCNRHHLPLFTAMQPRWGKPTDRTPATTARRYYDMVLEGRGAIGSILELLAEPPPKPTLIHCVAGRDRTGMVVACILDVLNVPDDIIAADYALSAIMDDAEGRNADPGNILGLLELIRADYGSTREMLLDSGVQPDTLADLRAAFLAM